MQIGSLTQARFHTSAAQDQNHYPAVYIFAGMKVAVFALFADATDWEAKHWLEGMLRWLAQQPAVAAVFLFTHHGALEKLSVAGLRTVFEKAPKAFWSRWQQRQRWRRQLADHNITSVLVFGHQSFFSTALPSYLILNAADAGNKALLRRLQPGVFKKIFVASEAVSGRTAGLLKDGAKNVQVLHGAPPAHSLTQPDTDLVRGTFTEGAPYFLGHTTWRNTDAAVLLLKAFSRFKRRQKSGWKLVLIATENLEKLDEMIATYKYRHDVVVVRYPDAEVMQALYAGSYCFVQPVPSYFGVPLLQAFSWGLPVIAAEESRAWAGPAGLYFAAGSEEGLAAHLMDLYKDEALQQTLAGAAAQRAGYFTWQPLLEAIGQPALEKQS